MKKFPMTIAIFSSQLISPGWGFAQHQSVINKLPPCLTACWDLGTKESCQEWSKRSGFGEDPDTVISNCPTEGCTPNNQKCITHPRFYTKTGPANTWNSEAQNLICSTNSLKKLKSEQQSLYVCLQERPCTCVQIGNGPPGCGTVLNDEVMTEYSLQNWKLEDAQACSAMDPP